MATYAGDNSQHNIGKLARKGHASHCTRCLQGLPATHAEMDASRMAIGFYSLGSLDIVDSVRETVNSANCESWKDWVWEQQSSGDYGTAFKGSSYMIGDADVQPLQFAPNYSEFDTPNLIMTYTAILILAILRDDFTRFERPGLIRFLKSCQREDGSFSAFPNSGEADLRPLYCAFAISSMLDDWSGVDIERALAYIQSCESYEGGYGQTPYGEALGGTTYCALASLALNPSASSASTAFPNMSPQHRAKTIHWLTNTQQAEGGFSGRTNKIADTCYCFWCGASLAMLGVADVVSKPYLASFLDRCQFVHGGIGKAPENHPDPYHTYMGLAALSIYSLADESDIDASWTLAPLNVLWNTTEATAEWIRKHLSRRGVQ